jgi:hypothetical protein
MNLRSFLSALSLLRIPNKLSPPSTLEIYQPIAGIEFFRLATWSCSRGGFLFGFRNRLHPPPLHPGLSPEFRPMTFVTPGR